MVHTYGMHHSYRINKCTVCVINIEDDRDAGKGKQPFKNSIILNPKINFIFSLEPL